MNFFKRSTALILAIILCISLGACANNGTAEKTFEFSLKNCTVVRSNLTQNGWDLSASVMSAIKKACGLTPKCIDDSVTAEGSEIVIGFCNRESTYDALEILSQNGNGCESDYIIMKKDGDIAIIGLSDSATEKAVEHFIESKVYASNSDEIIINSSAMNASTVTINGKNIGGTYLFNLSFLGWSEEPFFVVTPLYNHSYITELQVQKLISAVNNNTGKPTEEKKDSLVASLPSSLQSYSTASNYTTKEAYDAYNGTFNGLNKTVTEAWNTHEIIVGNCMREGCRTITDPDEFEVRIEGNKVYLNGGSPRATAMAVSEFIKLISGGNRALTDANSFTGSYYDYLPSYDKSSYYTLSWGDDFDGAEINEGLWHISYDAENVYSVGLNGRQNYRASKELKNNYVKDGKLYIDAVYTDEAYYGGMLITNNTMRYKYGYVEVSSMLPHGQGMWTALWASSATGEKGLAYTEIDISECYGPSHYVLGNTFAWLSSYGKEVYINNGFGTTARGHYHKRNDRFADARGFSMDFHTFGYEWDGETVRFICDGEVYQTMNYATQNYVVSSSAIDAKYEIECTVDAFSTPLYLRLSMALGFESRGYIVDDNAPEWQNSNSYISDYVHIYQYEGDKTYIYGASAREGDINADGTVDLLDSVDMSRYLATWNRYDFSHLDLGSGDLDGDGLVTATDLFKLNSLLAHNDSVWGDEWVSPDTGNDDEGFEDWIG